MPEPAKHGATKRSSASPIRPVHIVPAIIHTIMSTMAHFLAFFPQYGTEMQCLGYASLISDLLFGTDAPISMHHDFSKVRVGDHLRLYLWEHSMVVTEVGTDESGEQYVYVTEVNADYENCQIQWGRKFTQQDLRRLGDILYIYTRYSDENQED